MNFFTPVMFSSVALKMRLIYDVLKEHFVANYKELYLMLPITYLQ